jgi:glyoxylase-like metal-dependent hydrolase (beta-lactamase superfamily II)
MDERRMRSTSDLVPDIMVDDGTTLTVEDRTVITAWTPGHTPGHVCYVLEEEGIVFSGDHVLPRISSHVGAYSRSEVDPLGDYTRSLQRMARDFPDVEVLPGHEYRFRGLTTRVPQALAHHAERLLEVHASVQRRAAATAYEVARDITWSRGWDATTGVLRRLAVAETVAHLRWLERRLLLGRSGELPILWQLKDPDQALTSEQLIRTIIKEGEGR